MDYIYLILIWNILWFTIIIPYLLFTETGHKISYEFLKYLKCKGMI